MLKNILISRRLNKAKRRLYGTLPSKSVTISVLSVAKISVSMAHIFHRSMEYVVVGDYCDDDQLKIIEECHQKQPFFENEINSITATGLNCPRSTSHSCLNCDCTSSKNCFHSHIFIKFGEGDLLPVVCEDISLAWLVQTLIDSLNSKTVLSLDTIISLPEDENGNGSKCELLGCSRIEEDKCIFVRNMCYCTQSKLKADPKFLFLKEQGTSTMKKEHVPNWIHSKTSIFTEIPVFSCGIFPANFDTQAECRDENSSSYLFIDPLFAVCKAWRWPNLKAGEFIR